MSSEPELAIWSRDSPQRTPCFHIQLTIDHNVDAQNFFFFLGRWVTLIVRLLGLAAPL